MTHQRKVAACQSRQIGIAALLVLLLSPATPQANALTLTPGTLLGIEYNESIILQYDQNGTIIDSLDISPGNYSGITTIGSELFVLDDALAKVFRLDLTTGAKTFVLDTDNTINSGLGRKGGNLIFADFLAGDVSEYSTSGTLVKTTDIVWGIAGIDSDGSQIYASRSHSTISSDIQVYDSFGVLQDTIGLGLPPESTGDLTYDSVLNEIWIVTGSALYQEIRRISSDGTLLSSFESQWPSVYSITYISAIPEPNTLLLISFGLALFSGRNRSKRKSE